MFISETDDDDVIDATAEGGYPTAEPEKKDDDSRRLEQMLEAERQRNTALQQQLGSTVERMANLERHVVGQQPSEYERSCQAINDEEERIQNELNGLQAIAAQKKAEIDPQALQKLRARYKQVERHKIRVEAAAHMNQAGIRPLAASDTIRELIQSEYPDVTGNPQAVQYSQGLWAMKRAQNPGAGGPELLREVMAETRAKFKTGGSVKRTDTDKAKYVGPPTSSGTRAPNQTKSRKVSLDDAQKDIAQAVYPKLGREEAAALWAKKYGAKLQAAQQARGQR